MPSIEVGRDCEPSSGVSIADEVEDFGITVERLGDPVFGDFGEQAVFDGIPFGSAGGVVGNGDCESKAVAELGLKFSFPGAGTTTVAAASIGEDEQLSAALVAVGAVALPPAGDGVGGKSCGVMRDAYEDRASVGEQVIDTVGDRDADGIGTEIVIMDAHGRAVPLDAAVFEVADQFSFFGVDADNGQPLAFKAGTQRRDVTELLVAVGAGIGGDGFAIHTEGKIHIAKQSRYGIGRDLNIELPQQFGDSGRRFVGPPNAGDGISGDVVFQQDFDGGDYFGRFFSTGLRPAPDCRVRPISTS